LCWTVVSFLHCLNKKDLIKLKIIIIITTCIYASIYICLFLSMLHVAWLSNVRENNSWKIYIILSFYIWFIKNQLFIHDITFVYASSFVENTSSDSSANIASTALIRNDQDDELILWSKKNENKIELKKIQKEFKQWWISHRMKRRTLT
jgi:hypothetical protein